MSALYNLLMYALVFGAMATMFGTLLGIALWLLKVAWGTVTWLLISEPPTTSNDLQNVGPVSSYRI
jgi:hypothetical protein